MSLSSTFNDSDKKWMHHSLVLAQAAEAEGEVPVGAVIVRDDVLLGEGWNRNITLNDPSAHAEIVALREAGQRMNNHRLPGCVMYVSLEPCAMCVGAVIHARLERVVFGASDPKTGALGGAYDLPGTFVHNHRLLVQGGLLSDQAADMLRIFFRKRR